MVEYELPDGDVRLVNGQERPFWIRMQTGAGEFDIIMDRIGRPEMYGFVQVCPPKGHVEVPDFVRGKMGLCYDTRVVATVARLARHLELLPKPGEEIPLMTREEAEAYVREIGIPTAATEAAQMRAEAGFVNAEGFPARRM